MRFLSLHPLSSFVMLAETEEGWRLSDGHRFTKPYASFDAAIGDEATKRRLTYGEVLLNEEGG